MGSTVCHAVAADPDLELVAAVDPHYSGLDLRTVTGVDSDISVGRDGDALVAAGGQVAVDFTERSACCETLGFLAANDIHAVVGTTGFTDEDMDRFVAEFTGSNCVIAPNFAIGAVLMMHFAALAAPYFESAEVIELHHEHKVDAPSGTALKMGEVIAQAQARTLADCAVYTREGITGERDPSSIGFATIRGGDIVGDHTVLFAGTGERIEISHKSSSRATYAQGGLRAVRFLAGKQNGIFDMFDVLGLR